MGFVLVHVAVAVLLGLVGVGLCRAAGTLYAYRCRKRTEGVRLAVRCLDGGAL